MRIATTQFQATMNRSLQLNQGALTRLTQQMASGARIQVPSDDPVANVRLSRLAREEAAVDQYKENIAAVQIRMQKDETYLSSMVTDSNLVRDQLVWALDGSNTPADLNSMVNALISLRDSLLYNGNVKDQEGRYIFSGTWTDDAPLVFDPAGAPGARYSYGGNSGQQQVVVGNGIVQAVNVNLDGQHLFLNQLDDAIVGLQASTASPNDPALRAILVAALDGTDVAMGTLSSKIAMLGGAQNIMRTLGDNHANVSLSNQLAIADLGKLDYATAATELTGYEVALQSTYKAYAKISGLSLFDVL